MYNKIYQILDEKGRAKTGIFLDGPYMGKKCILKPETVIREENCGEAAEKKIRCTADPPRKRKMLPYGIII